MSSSVLFVCTYWGVRSQIAALFCKREACDSLLVESAGFESGTIGNLPRSILKSRGLELPATSPPTLFNFARRDEPFDSVITLCNQGSQENYGTLYDVVELLFAERSNVVHWDIPDFMAIRAEGDDRLAAAEAIVDQIESQVSGWLIKAGLNRQ